MNTRWIAKGGIGPGANNNPTTLYHYDQLLLVKLSVSQQSILYF